MPANPETRSPFPAKFPNRPEVRIGMPEDDIMKVLKERTASYEDLSGFPIVDNGEGLVPVPDTVGLTYYQRSSAIHVATGPRVFLREGFVARLVAAGKDLNRQFPGYKFGILEGYRPLEQQEIEFDAAVKYIRENGTYKDEKDLKNQAHLISAAPDVGGHVAAGAADFEVLNRDGVPVRRGAAMSDWKDNKIWTHHPDIPEEAKFVRDISAQILAKHGVLIFDGEVWHAHFGDVEYAWLMKWDHAIYGPRNFTDSERFSHLDDPKAIRFEEFVGSTYGKSIQLPSDPEWQMPQGLRSVNRKEPVGLQRVNLRSEDSPVMERPSSK